MKRAEKAAQVDFLKDTFANAGVVLVTHYSGLSVAEMTALRGRFREADAKLRVIKNRLAKIALDQAPTEEGKDLFQGPVAIAFAPDPVGVSKIAVDYAKENENFVLLGGFLGETVLDESGVKALATMPSLDELRAKLVGVLNAPGGKFARTLNAPGSSFATALSQGAGSRLVNVLNAYVQKEQAA